MDPANHDHAVAFDSAAQLEEGRSPVTSSHDGSTTVVDEKLGLKSPMTSKSSTFAATTKSSISG